MTLVRPLADDDMTEVAAFINTCWRQTYASILDAGFLAGLTTQGRVDILRRKLAAGMAGLVALDDDGALIGMTLYGPTHLAVLAGAGEINMIYLRADHIGTGLGHRLFAQTEVALLARGYKTLGLDVFTDNKRAIAFYEAHGYEKVGAKIDLIEGHEYLLDIMAKSEFTG